MWSSLALGRVAGCHSDRVFPALQLYYVIRSNPALTGSKSQPVRGGHKTQAFPPHHSGHRSMESSLWDLITVFKYLRGYHWEERDLFGVEPEEKIKTKGGSYKKTE